MARGELCGFVRLLDSTEPAHQHLQTTLRERAASARNRGLWLSLTKQQLESAVVLGIDRRGSVLVTIGRNVLYFLHATGIAESMGSFADLQRYLRDDLARELWEGEGHSEVEVPDIHATDRPPSEIAFAALVAGDRAAAESAIERFAGREVLPFAWIDLVRRLAGPDGDAVDNELRVDTIVEVYTLAKRRMPTLGERVPLHELRRAVGSGNVTTDLLDRLTAIGHLRVPSFFDAPDLPTENDVPNAADRGLIPPLGLQIDLAATLASWIEDWRSQDPATSIDPLLEHIERLPRVVRDGYVFLVACLGDDVKYDAAVRDLRDAEDHLTREISDAWPMLVLALRSIESWQSDRALDLLRARHVRETVPYLKALVEHPPDHVSQVWNGEAAYVDIAELSSDAIKELFLGYLAPQAQSTGRRRTVAYEALVPYADDDRVLEQYLARFIPALPHSDAAIERAHRWNDRRVIPALHAQLAMEERRVSAGESRKQVEYSDSYGLVARRLAELGDQDGKAALATYKRSERRAMRRDF